MTSLTFAATATGAASAQQRITLTNDGGATLIIAGSSVSDTVDFSLTSTCGSALAVHSSCVLAVLFQPQSATPFTASFTITDNSGGVTSAQTVALAGNGTPAPEPWASLSANSVTFPQTIVGSSSAGQIVTLNNTGTFALTLTAFALTDTQNFSMSSTCGSSLPVGSSCVFQTTFTPKSGGSFTAYLDIPDNSGGVNSVQAVTLSGTGIAQPMSQASLSTSSLTFASTAVVVTSPPQTVTLTNSGTGPLLLASVSVSDAADFVVTNACPASLAAAASCIVSIAFQPTTVASYTASPGTLTFTDNAGGVATASQTVALHFLVASSVTNFGDSITCGYFATPNNGTGYVLSPNGYAGLFNAALAVPAQNLCRAGDQAADMARYWVYPNTMPALGANQLYTVMIGTNDANACGNSTGCHTNYTLALSAALAWLGMPASDKVLASATTQSGYWFADPDLSYSLGTYAPGSSLTFQIQQKVAGRYLDLVNRVATWSYYAGGTAIVTIDGVYATTLHSDSQTGVSIATENQDAETEVLTRVPLGAVATHTVTITNTSPSGVKFDFIWAGVSTGSYPSVPGAPRVLAGGPITSGNTSLVPILLDYDALVAQTVQTLAGEGLYIELVPSGGALNPATDFHDALHPNNQGHQKLANIFLSVP